MDCSVTIWSMHDQPAWWSHSFRDQQPHKKRPTRRISNAPIYFLGLTKVWSLCSWNTGWGLHSLAAWSNGSLSNLIESDFLSRYSQTVWCYCSIVTSGSAFGTSVGISSGPGALPFLSCLMALCISALSGALQLIGRFVSVAWICGALISWCQSVQQLFIMFYPFTELFLCLYKHISVLIFYWSFLWFRLSC